MKRIYTLIFLLTSFATAFCQQGVIFNNPSFEGTSMAHVAPEPWDICYGSPDTQPGQWGITKPASHGNTYISFLHGADGINGYNEGISQLLPQCLTAGTLYHFAIDAAFSTVYNTAEPGTCYGSLQLLGGSSLCDSGEVLWLSGMITDTAWNTYSVSFTPTQDWCYLTFSPYLIDTCNGYINCMIDNINGNGSGNQVIITSPEYLSNEHCGFLVTGTTDTISDVVLLEGNFMGSPVQVNMTTDTTWEKYIFYPDGFYGTDHIYAHAFFQNYADSASTWVIVNIDTCASGNRLEITSPGNNFNVDCGFMLTGLTDSLPVSIRLAGAFTGSPLNAASLTDTTWEQYISYPYGFTGTDTIYATGFFQYDTVIDWVAIIRANITAPQQLCVVAVDSTTDKNILIWEKEITTFIERYLIYKETNQNNMYSEIGSVPYDSLSVFIDTLSNPSQNANRYKLAIIDTCGLPSVFGQPHKTIHLLTSPGLNGVINLSWNQYEGLPILTYNIYRGQSPSSVNLLASVASNIVMFTDNFPVIGQNYYYVEAVLPDSCTPFRSGYIGSLSNYSSQSVLSVPEYNAENFFSVSPNPNTGDFTVNFNAITSTSGFITLYDIPGQLLYRSEKISIDNHSVHPIRVNEIADGIYFLKVETEYGIFVKKVVVK